VKGNPKDSELCEETVEEEGVQKIPRSVVTDGGYVSKENLEYAKKAGIVNIVSLVITSEL
jgi:hypothetical protein